MNQETGARKRTITNFLSLSVLQIGNYVLPMITLPIISRIIGPEKYGAINYSFAFVGYFIMFINAGFDLYGTRMIISYEGNKEKIDQLFSRITFAKTYSLIVATVVFAISSLLITQVREEMVMNIFTYLMCIGWVVNPSWLYNGMQDAKRYAMFSFVSKLLFSVAVVLMVREKSDYIYHPLITSIAHILVSFISFRFAMNKYNIKLVWVKMKDAFQTLKENRNLSLIWWITNQSSSTGIIVAGFMLTSAALGYYSAALRMIIIILSVVSMPLNTVLFPYIGQAFVKSVDEGIRRVNKVLPYLLFISITLAVATLFISKPLILLFFGKGFAESVWLLKILSVVLFFSTLNNAFGQQIMLNLKKDKLYTKLIVISFLLNIVFLVSFIAGFGIIGAAIAWPLCELVIFSVYLVYFKKTGIQIVDYNYYKPAYLLSQASKVLKFNILKRKPLAQ